MDRTLPTAEGFRQCQESIHFHIPCPNALMKPWLLAFFLAFPGCPLSAAEVNVELPKAGLVAEELGVVVNDNDPDSASIAEYYLQRRGIPRENLLHVRFAANTPNLPLIS